MNRKGLFNATAAGFVPADRRGRDLLSSLQTHGKPVFLTVRTARNPEFSALAHLVFAKVAAGIGVPMPVLKAYLKDRTGRYDLALMPDGNRVKVRHSVAFEAMSEEQFREFWNDVGPIITEELLGGVASKERDEIVDIMNGKDRDFAR